MPHTRRKNTGCFIRNIHAGGLVFLGLVLFSSPSGAENYLLETFPRRLVQGTKRSFRGYHLSALVIGGALAGTISIEDKGFQRHIQRRRPIGDAEKAGTLLGSPPFLFACPGLVYAAARLGNDSKLAQTGKMMLESLSLTGMTALSLKLITRKNRPDGSDRLSFPSLHAAGSFGLATVIKQQYGWKAGIWAYATSSFISFSRLQENKHFASDTLFGAVLGTTIAHAVWQVNIQETKGKFTLVPAFGGIGIAARW